MSTTFVVDVSGIETSIRDFPNGVYEAEVKSAELDVSKKSAATMLRMQLEIYSPELGVGTIRDFLPENFKAKVKAFWQAINDFTPEEIAQNPVVEINPPDLVNARILIALGEQENKETNKVYKTVVAPWYYPVSRAGELLADSSAN